MTALQQSLSIPTTDPGDDIIHIELDITSLDDVFPGRVLCGYTAFDRAFAATPRVIGKNIITGATTGSLRIQATAAGATYFLQGVTTNDIVISGTVEVEATFKGRLA